MPLFTILSVCVAATVLLDIVIALYGLVRSEIFWPLAFGTSLGGLSAVFMILAFLDFDASNGLYAALGVLGGIALVSLLPAMRSMA